MSITRATSVLFAILWSVAAETPTCVGGTANVLQPKEDGKCHCQEQRGDSLSGSPLPGHLCESLVTVLGPGSTSTIGMGSCADDLLNSGEGAMRCGYFCLCKAALDATNETQVTCCIPEKNSVTRQGTQKIVNGVIQNDVADGTRARMLPTAPLLALAAGLLTASL